jgi:uncharacterized membrane protein
VYDTLLFLHLLGAFIAFVTVGVFAAWSFGAPVQRGSFQLADAAWNVSGLLLTVFGIWLALYIDSYELWDGWILGALVLLGVASMFGAWARRDVLELVSDDGTVSLAGTRVALWNWLRTLSVVAIIVLMVWKPGA